MTIWRMRFAGWIPKATNTHSACLTLIALPLQQWLHERPSMLTLYVHCLSLLIQFVASPCTPHCCRRCTAQNLPGRFLLPSVTR